jgi:hypothetical protein
VPVKLNPVIAARRGGPGVFGFRASRPASGSAGMGAPAGVPAGRRVGGASGPRAALKTYRKSAQRI